MIIMLEWLERLRGKFDHNNDDRICTVLYCTGNINKKK